MSLTLRFWMWVVVVVAGSDGFVWVTHPDLVQSPAYRVAKAVIPGVAIGWLFVVAAATAAVSLIIYERAPYLVTVSLVIHGFVCGLVGLSIFALSLNGTTSAITGASKWWVFFVVALQMLRRPTTRALA